MFTKIWNTIIDWEIYLENKLARFLIRRLGCCLYPSTVWSAIWSFGPECVDSYVKEVQGLMDTSGAKTEREYLKWVSKFIQQIN